MKRINKSQILQPHRLDVQIATSVRDICVLNHLLLEPFLNSLKPLVQLKSFQNVLILIFYLIGAQLSFGQTYNTPAYNLGSDISSVIVAGLPVPICGNTSGVTTTSVLDALNVPEAEYLLAEKGTPFSFQVQVTHNQLNTTIEVLYLNDAGTPQEFDSLIYGSTLFSTPGFPISDNFPVSYTPQKGSLGDVIQIRFTVFAGPVYNIYIPVAVQGIIDERVPILGTFITPQIPYMILHDPPGDEGTATFTQTDEYCRSVSTTYATSDSKGFTATAQFGIEYSAGFIGIFESPFVATVAVTGGLNITTDISEGKEVKRCVTTSNQFQTGDGPTQIGHSEDKYIGMAIRYKYGIYDRVLMENCQLKVQPGLVYTSDPNGLTQFDYTEAAIMNDIESQRAIANNLNNPLIQRERAFNQIDVWQKILDRNKNNRDNADYPDSFSQSAGPATTRTEILSTTSISNISYNVALDANVSVIATALIAGNGFFGGPQFSFNTSQGSSITNEQGMTTEISYRVQDWYDQIDYEVGKDPDYGTPMFRLSEVAYSSCPYEGGERLDRPRIYVSKGLYQCPYVTLENINGNTETVMVTICNDHPTETRNFSVIVEGNGNSLGMNFNGSSLDDGLQRAPVGNIDPLSCVTIPLVLTKGVFNSYNGIKLRVFPSCFGEFLLAATTNGALLDLIAEENDSLTINVTFGGPGNYPADLDCDGVPDNLDPCPTMTSEGDDDCDGIVNSLDVCPLGPNTDTDLDGFPDCVDLCPGLREGSLNFDRNPALPDDNQADYVSIPHDPRLNLAGRDFTIEAWVRPTDEYYKTIISKGDTSNAGTNFAWVIWNRNSNDPASGKLGLLLYGEWRYSDNQIPLNRWTHVAVTYEKDGSLVEFYIDGQFSGQKSYSISAQLPNSYNMSIGLRGNDISPKRWGFKGSLDELSLWNRKLEQAEIQERMSHALQASTPNLIAYYKFDDNAPCAAGGSNILFDKGPLAGATGPFNGTLQTFDLISNSCISNWSEGRNADLNEDGLGDICSFSDCLSQDSDNDGYSDCVDLCPNTADAALHFDGTNWAETFHVPDIVGAGNFAFSSWIYPTSDDLSTIASQGNGSNAQTAFILVKLKGDGTGFPIKDHNKIGLFLANGTNAEWKLSSSVVPLNEWSHVAVSVQNGIASFYINGKFDGAQTYSFNNFYNTNVGPMYIGRQGQTCNCNYFKGRLDDMSIWSKSLRLEEVKAIYSKGISGNESNLIAAFNFNQGTPCQNNIGANLLFDVSANGTYFANMFNFNLNSEDCDKNWTHARNADSDGDGIGDACETSTFICVSNAVDATSGPDSDYLDACLDLCAGTTETSLHFDGLDDFVTVPHHVDLNLADGDFTLEFWIKPGAINQDVSLINKGHGVNNSTIYNLMIKGPLVPQLRHKVGLNMSGEWVFSNSRILANEWTHIAVTFDISEKTIRFYINGQLDSQPRILSSTNPLYNADLGALFIGKDQSGISGTFNGSMEDIIIWDKMLSSADILRTMQAGLNGNETNLEAYYKFDDGVPYLLNFTETILQDSGPNNLDGQLNNFALAGIVSNWAPGRNADSDGDGVGDGCDDGLPCPPNYAGLNALDMTLLFSNKYETNGIIETSQMINSPINLIYNSATAVQLFPGFEVNQAVLEIRTTGCSQN